MLDRKEVEAKMAERGFSVMSYGINNGNYISIHFISEEKNFDNSNRVRVPPFACNVDLVNETFELAYVIATSVNTLRSAKCGSVMNDSHFSKICAKFEDQVYVLYRYFGRI